jgi:RNA polymerase-binding transcription factor DksA
MVRFVRHTHSISVKQALLKKLDQTFQRDFHQSLSEILTELRIRNAVGKSLATPDSIFAAIQEARILDCKSTSAVLEMRAALERMAIGKFGLCVRCGRTIQAIELEREPLRDSCSSCGRKRVTGGFPSRRVGG